MADKKRYQVLSPCVIVPTVAQDGNEYLTTIYAPGVFEADPDNVRVKHNLDSKYIQEIDAKAVAGSDASGAVMLDDQRVDGANPGAPVVLNDPGVVNERAHADVKAAVEQDAQAKSDADVVKARAAAKAKLPPDGSAPDGRASKDVFVEYLAGKGYDYAELSKQDKAELQKLAASQS